MFISIVNDTGHKLFALTNLSPVSVIGDVVVTAGINDTAEQ
jgi:hypothetical protein